MKVNLPKDWKLVKLGDVLDIQGGSQPPKSTFLYQPKKGYVQLLQIRDFGERGVPTFVPKEKVTKFCTKEDIMIARYGASLGRIMTGMEGAYNVAMAKVIDENNLFEKKYIYYLLKTSIFQGPLKLLSRSAQNGFSKSEISHIELPLPPKQIQTTIVSKIEELFSELDKGIENLRLAQQQLKTYRQAVLKWAFEGRLMNENVKEGELPAGWKIQKLNDIGTWKGGGTPAKSNKAYWEKGNILWVSPKDMKSKVIHDTIDKITIHAIENSSTKLVNKGSILFVVRSGILRRTLPVAITICDVTVNQDLQAFTPKDVLTEYVYWYVQAKNEDIRKDCSKDGTTVESIESALLKNYLIPVCSVLEQERVVQEIENRFSVTDKMEEGINQSLLQAESLRQSILKKAFNGKLV